MAGKITDLTGLSSVASGDKLEIVDVSDTTDGADGTSKHITQSNLLGSTLSSLSSSLTASASELNALDGITASTTELNYTDGVTSNIQTQLDAKQATISLTASRAMVTNGSGVPAAATTTSTEIGYVNGVTSAIQTQLNAKEPTLASASTSAQGKVELATTAETDTGTDTARAVTPDGLAGSNYGEKGFCISVFDSVSSVATGDGTQAFTVPSTLNGFDLVEAIASVHTKGITGTTDVQIRRRRAGSNADMLSTKITLGDEFFVADGVINASNDDVATGDQIYVDVDAIHSGTAPLGLSVALMFRLP